MIQNDKELKASQQRIAYFQNLLLQLRVFVTSVGYRCDTPSISSDGDGYVTAVWYKNERQLHLQIGEHEAEYFKVWETNIGTEMEVDCLTHEEYLPLWNGIT